MRLALGGFVPLPWRRKCLLMTQSGHRRVHAARWRFWAGAAKTSTGLFVIADAAALVVDLCNKGLFGNRLSRSGLREVIVYREDSSS